MSITRLTVLLLLCLVYSLPVQADGLHVLTVKGAISPASADYLVRGIDRAADAQANLVVIELDTPGGLDTSMRDIIKAILASPVPIATYVSPKDARAASAGTYILYASHIAAMAAATNLGVATPVELAPGSAPPEKPATPDKKGDKPAINAPVDTPLNVPQDAKMKKVVHDAAAEILSRNPQAMQLRYLQTLSGIAGDRTNTIVFPVPGDFLELLLAAIAVMMIRRGIEAFLATGVAGTS